MIKKIIFFTLIGLGVSSGLSAFPGNIAVIVNANASFLSSINTPLEIKNIKDLYLGKKLKWDSTVIKGIDQKNKELISEFLQKVCAMRISEYQNHWVKLELDTGLSSPKVVENSQEVIAYVQKDSAGVGYVWENEAKNVEGIKVVLVLTD